MVPELKEAHDMLIQSIIDYHSEYSQIGSLFAVRSQVLKLYLF